MNEPIDALKRVLLLAREYLKSLDEKGKAIRLEGEMYTIKELVADYKILRGEIDGCDE